MVILRRTNKLSSALPEDAEQSSRSDTALGDWYVNRLSVDRRPLLILISAKSLLPMLLPARDVRSLPDRLSGLVAVRLKRLGIPARLIDAEVRAMAPVVVAPTLDRSVVGILVDFAKAVPLYLEPGRWDEGTLPFVEAHLAGTPCHASGRAQDVIFPKLAAPAALTARWVAATEEKM